MMDKYTPEQIEIQAKCFQLLVYRINQQYKAHKNEPWSPQKDYSNDVMIGSIARWIIEDNHFDAFGKEWEE